MNGISKGLFLGSIAIGLGITLVLGIVIQVIRLSGGSADTILTLSALSLLPMLYGAIFMLVLNYKAWAAIQDGHARTTPGKAIGFLFIPFFDLYWLFQAIWGLAKDFNAYLERKSIPSPRLPEGIFLAYCILSFVAWIPFLGLVVGIVNYIFALIMVSGLCDAINAAAKPPLTAPAAIGRAPCRRAKGAVRAPPRPDRAPSARNALSVATRRPKHPTDVTSSEAT